MNLFQWVAGKMRRPKKPKPKPNPYRSSEIDMDEVMQTMAEENAQILFEAWKIKERK